MVSIFGCFSGNPEEHRSDPCDDVSLEDRQSGAAQQGSRPSAKQDTGIVQLELGPEPGQGLGGDELRPKGALQDESEVGPLVAPVPVFGQGQEVVARPGSVEPEEGYGSFSENDLELVRIA